jgi:hypothetical protein
MLFESMPISDANAILLAEVVDVVWMIWLVIVACRMKDLEPRRPPDKGWLAPPLSSWRAAERAPSLRTGRRRGRSTYLRRAQNVLGPGGLDRRNGVLEFTLHPGQILSRARRCQTVGRSCEGDDYPASSLVGTNSLAVSAERRTFAGIGLRSSADVQVGFSLTSARPRILTPGLVLA